jgi:hypothetical protein
MAQNLQALVGRAAEAAHVAAAEAAQAAARDELESNPLITSVETDLFAVRRLAIGLVRLADGFSD